MEVSGFELGYSLNIGPTLVYIMLHHWQEPKSYVESRKRDWNGRTKGMKDQEGKGKGGWVECVQKQQLALCSSLAQLLKTSWA
jgi:hypothetical protein